MIAFYYGLTGIACAVYWRHELLRSAKNFLFIGVAPVLGAGMLAYLLYESVIALADPKDSYQPKSDIFGLGIPLAIAIIFVGLGLILMVALAAVRAARREGVLPPAAVRVRTRRGRCRRGRQGRGDRDVGGGGRRGWPRRRRGGQDAGAEGLMPRALIVGYDGSECADAALDAAIQLGAITGDSIVVGFGYEPGGYGEEHTAHREEVRKFGERITKPALERAAAAGCDATLALIPERPAEALVALAAEHNARAIVVGTHGERPIKAAILGSTPHKLLHVSDHPVLVVPVPES